ncbi:MAG: DUF1566 domain-containing protein [bacterium]|nr:DUF1566 domain-containing protein [bacterium]
MKSKLMFLIVMTLIPFMSISAVKYPVVDTGQNRCYENGKEIPYPKENEPFSGQDAQYESNPPAYRNNGDGTVTDLNTGLMWQKAPDFVKRTVAEAGQYAESLSLAGYNDWRVPTIKELFSIADFNGNMRTQTPYIDTRYFDFQYPDTGEGWRIIDAQYRSRTRYRGTTMGRHNTSFFGFNFADGRIKGYPADGPGAGRQYIRCVRGKAYGENDFADNGDGTVSDRATGLMWMKVDSGKPMNWEQALKYAENLKYAGYDDWRLPNVKELQSIVDYTRAPDARKKSARGAAITPVFELTDMESWFWTGTTHIENGFGYYVCFGQAFSAWVRRGKKMNAHGAGAVRSDPKTGDPSSYADGLGPQGDEIRIYNYVRCVRGGAVEWKSRGPAVDNRVMRQNGRTGQRGQRVGQRGPMDGNAFIRRLDKNGDGKVSKIEFDGPQHHFKKLDRNGDGYLSAEEAPKGPPPGRKKANHFRGGK